MVRQSRMVYGDRLIPVLLIRLPDSILFMGRFLPGSVPMGYGDQMIQGQQILSRDLILFTELSLRGFLRQLLLQHFPFNYQKVMPPEQYGHGFLVKVGDGYLSRLCQELGERQNLRQLLIQRKIIGEMFRDASNQKPNH